MQLKGEKLRLARILGRVGIAYGKDLAVMSGAKEYTATRKRLLDMEKMGFVNEAWREGKKAYCLTAAGLSVSDTTIRKPFQIKGQTTDHSLLVSMLAAYIHLNKMISIDSIFFDADMRGMAEFQPEGKRGKGARGTHMPDLICGSTAFEVELNAKSKRRLAENIAAESRVFSGSVWIVPSHLKSLQRQIMEEARKNGFPVSIISVENLEERMKRPDLSKNSDGKPAPLKLKKPEAYDLLKEEFQ